MTTVRNIPGRLAAAMLVSGALVLFGGCETKEEVLDVETPSGELEVEKDPETGATDVEVNEE